MSEYTLTRDGPARGKTIVLVKQDGKLFHSDTVLLTDAASRAKFVATLMAKLPAVDLDPDPAPMFERWLLDLIGQPDPASETVGADPPPADKPDPAAIARQAATAALAITPPGVVAEAEAMLADPQLVARLVGDFEAVEVFGEKELATTVYLIGTSRLLAKPLAGIVYGQTASGKSYVPEQVSKLFPPDAVLTAHQMTPQALAHLPPGSLCHKWIVAGERSRQTDDDRAECTRLLRELLQSGRVVKLMPERVDGRIVTVTLEQEGPVSYTESTTLEDVFDEDGNRTLALRTDDSEAQTKLIVGKIAARAKGGVPADAGPTRAVHRAAQLLLQERFTGVEVVVPFADRIATRFDCGRVDSRRHFGHLLALTRAVALLHAFQREVRDGAVIADPVDYQIAARLATDPFKKAGGGLSPTQLKFLDRLRSQFTDNEFTSVNARFGEAAGKSTVDGWLAKLVDEGLVEQTYASRGGRGNPSRYQLVKDGTPKSGLRVPDPSEVFAS